MTKEYKTKKYIKYVEIKITCPNKEISEEIANSLVNNKLVACVQIVSLDKSIYLWNGKIEKQEEVLLIVKTRARYFKSVEKKVKNLHPYTTPEIIALPIIKANDEYLRWIDDSLGLETVDFENNKAIKKNK